MTLKRVFIIICLVSAGVQAAEQALASVVLTDSDAPVAVAAAWQAAAPSLIGADGPLLTQVEAAQRLGLSGKDMTVCVIDTGVDVTHSNFGSCAEGPRSRGCRVAFGYDAETDSRDPSPTPAAAGAESGHGTHVAGIAVGSFPNKLLDATGKPLPYQRGVAFGAKLGAIRAVNKEGAFTGDNLNRALHKTVREDCDVNNLSLGSFHVVPNPAYRVGMEQIASADILTAAAAGNDEGATTLGPRLFNTASPASYPDVFAVAHLNNTANPGSLIEISEKIGTASGLQRSTLVAIQRADTQTSSTSLCSPSCDGLPLPMNMYLVSMAPELSQRGSTECGLKLIFDASEYKRNQVLVVQFEPQCKFYHTSADLWGYLRNMSPALVLMVMPTDDDTHSGALYYKNAQTPVLWMRSDDGRALSETLALRDTKSLPPLQLKRIPGSTIVPVPDEFAGQPAETSSMGPGFDLSLKPDIACPGSLYSSLPNDTYQTWPGTSMASPYMAGVLALWKDRVVNQLRTDTPPGGWINAAFTALKNTAKPIKYGDTALVWPPAKVGAGMVQAFSAVVNNVTITPPELLMRTDVSQQTFTVVIANQGSTDVTYTLGHQPAVTLSLGTSWYNKIYDVNAPTAIVTGVERTVKVPARGTRIIKVGITLPAAMRSLDVIFSGYITFTPLGVSSSALKQRPLSANTPVVLSLPYQGSSKDYSTVGTAQSLALFVPALPDLHAAAAQLISEKPPLYVCDYSQRSGCTYSPDGVTVEPDSMIKGFMLASTLLRPLADVKIQVFSMGPFGDHDELLGTSDSLGPAPASSPFRRTYLFEGSWDGTYIPTGSVSATWVAMQKGLQYKLKLELHPVLAAGDRAAGRSPGLPLIYTVHEPVALNADVTVAATEALIQVASSRDSRRSRDRDRDRDRDRRDM